MSSYNPVNYFPQAGKRPLNTKMLLFVIDETEDRRNDRDVVHSLHTIHKMIKGLTFGLKNIASPSLY